MMEGGRVGGGSEGGLRKGTSYGGNELGMDGARERGEGRSERRGRVQLGEEDVHGGA